MKHDEWEINSKFKTFARCMVAWDFVRGVCVCFGGEGGLEGGGFPYTKGSGACQKF